MKCFTFTNCQLKKGLKITKAPSRTIIGRNGVKVTRDPADVLSLGKFVHGSSRDMNYARNMYVYGKNPAEVIEMPESERIVRGLSQSGCFGFCTDKTRCVLRAFPFRDGPTLPDGSQRLYPFLANEKVLEKNAQHAHSDQFFMIRIKTFSYESGDKQRHGEWFALQGYPRAVVKARGTDNGCSWVDDLVTMKSGDVVKVITMGSESDDDQIVANIGGFAWMFPASTPITDIAAQISAEEVEQNLADALEAFEPEEMTS